MHADLQRLLAAELLTDIGSKPIERLRGIRTELTGAEGDISFVRRVTQGRLDIVGHEADRRTGGTATGSTASEADAAADGSGGAAGETAAPDGAAAASALLFEMPEILTDGQAPGAARQARQVEVMEPGPIAMSLVDTLNQMADPPTLSGVEDLAQGQLADLFDSLREMEIELSSLRRQLHDRIDLVQDEIARRYRDGEASIENLLR